MLYTTSILIHFCNLRKEFNLYSSSRHDMTELIYFKVHLEKKKHNWTGYKATGQNTSLTSKHPNLSRGDSVHNNVFYLWDCCKDTFKILHDKLYILVKLSFKLCFMNFRYRYSKFYTLLSIWEIIWHIIEKPVKKRTRCHLTVPSDMFRKYCRDFSTTHQLY